VEGGGAAAGEPPAAVDELAAEVAVEAGEGRLDERQFQAQLVVLGSGGDPILAWLLERRSQSEQDPLPAPVRWPLVLFLRLLESLEASDHLALAKRGRLPVEQRVDADEVADPWQPSEAAGVEEAAGVDSDEKGVAQIVDDLEAEVVVSAAVKQLGDATVAAGELVRAPDQRRERAGERGRGGDSIGSRRPLRSVLRRPST
jgi:hypothetical protein